MTGRLQSGEIKAEDILKARERLTELLTGRKNPISDEEIKQAIDLGDISRAEELGAQRMLFEDIIAELSEAKDWQSTMPSGYGAPTTAQVLEGADVASDAVTHLERKLAASYPEHGVRTRARQQRALESADARARELQPEGTPEDSSSLLAATYGEARRRRDEARELVSDPYEDIRLSLEEHPGIPMNSIDRVMRNIRNMDDVSEVSAMNLDDNFVETLRGFSTDGPRSVVSAANFRDGLREVGEKIRRLEDLGEESKARILKIQYGRMKDLVLRHADPETRAKLIKADKEFREFKETYEPGGKVRGRNRSGEEGQARIIAQRAAQLIEKDTGDPLSIIFGSTGVTPVDVAKQMRNILGPDGTKNLEDLLWRRIFEKSLDPLEGRGGARKAMRETQDDSALIQVYREIAGDEAADAVPQRLKEIRQSRISAAGTAEQSHRPGSYENVIEAVASNPSIGTATGAVAKESMRKILDSLAFRGDQIDRVMKEAMLDPAIAHDILNLPTREAFEAWRERIVGYSARATARESGRTKTRKGEE